LGAGLDTRAVRKPAPGVTYFEIEDVALSITGLRIPTSKPTRATVAPIRAANAIGVRTLPLSAAEAAANLIRPT